jgi:hypothetical protein
MAGPVTAKVFAARARGSAASTLVHKRGIHFHTKIAGRQYDAETYSTAKSKLLLDDMTLVRQRFGLNVSEAIRVAIHLTAEAIRANKSLPEVE